VSPIQNQNQYSSSCPFSDKKKMKGQVRVDNPHK
jgi:hypothetical protein